MTLTAIDNAQLALLKDHPDAADALARVAADHPTGTLIRANRGTWTLMYIVTEHPRSTRKVEAPMDSVLERNWHHIDPMLRDRDRIRLKDLQLLRLAHHVERHHRTDPAMTHQLIISRTLSEYEARHGATDLRLDPIRPGDSVHLTLEQVDTTLATIELRTAEMGTWDMTITRTDTIQTLPEDNPWCQHPGERSVTMTDVAQNDLVPIIVTVMAQIALAHPGTERAYLAHLLDTHDVDVVVSAISAPIKSDDAQRVILSQTMLFADEQINIVEDSRTFLLAHPQSFPNTDAWPEGNPAIRKNVLELITEYTETGLLPDLVGENETALVAVVRDGVLSMQTLVSND